MQNKNLKVYCIGGGPGGLYFSILLKRARPDTSITIFERNPRGSTFGWGVVFSDETLGNLLEADPETSKKIHDTLNHWDDIEVFFKGKALKSGGHGFCGISRQKLLTLLEDRALELGVDVQFGKDAPDDGTLKDADLIVGCDGIFSKVREKYARHFSPHIEKRNCRYTWLGTKRRFDAFSFLFEETPHGWFQAHCYRFDKETSTFIVEAPEEVWRKAGIDQMSNQQSVAFCESLFGKYLDGHSLMSNSAHLIGSAAWICFQRVTNAAWSCKNENGIPLVLLGDAAATAHFSVGSGTKLAMESAIALAKEVAEAPDLASALTRYEDVRRVEVLKLQNAARNSTEWFETVESKSYLPPEQFAYSLLTRSQRVSHENLRLRDQKYLEQYEGWLSTTLTNGKLKKSRPPMFIPFQAREIELTNRVVVSPMAMYSATDGIPSDFHLVHLGGLALGGAGLVFTEMACVSPEARITPGCAGIYNDKQAEAWKRIVDFVHSESPAKIALQLGHSGPKGSTKVGWEGMDDPLDEGNWELLAPSPSRYSEKNQLPREMTKTQMQQIKAEFVAATEKAAKLGFDWLELHCAHGYLLSSFISPLRNFRTDEYGGSLEKRLRFPLEIFEAMRAVWPKEKPMSVRISACDWVDGGTTVEDAVKIAALFKEQGADLMDISSGQVSPDQKPVYGRMYQTPFSEKIRHEVRIKTMAVGSIFEPDHANSIIAAGRADLCLLARPHLADPHWTLRAAAELGYKEQWWPKQYLSGKPQLETNLLRAKQMRQV